MAEMEDSGRDGLLFGGATSRIAPYSDAVHVQRRRHDRHRPSKCRMLGAAASLLLAPGVFSQTAVKAIPKATKSWTAPRTPDGHPDLQGVWTNGTITPLERPAELAGKEF